MRNPGAGFTILRREADTAGSSFVVSFQAYSIKEKSTWR
jgi:hypothetical protein